MPRFLSISGPAPGRSAGRAIGHSLAHRAERPVALRTGLVLALPLLLAGCLEAALGPAAVVGGASLVFTGRTPIDHVASLATGRDCSAVRLERYQPWCAPLPGPPDPQPFCTRSLGSVDCWTRPPDYASGQLANPPSPGVHEALAGPVTGAPPEAAPAEVTTPPPAASGTASGTPSGTPRGT